MPEAVRSLPRGILKKNPMAFTARPDKVRTNAFLIVVLLSINADGLPLLIKPLLIIKTMKMLIRGQDYGKFFKTPQNTSLSNNRALLITTLFLTFFRSKTMKKYIDI